jgi:hypothetical protein
MQMGQPVTGVETRSAGRRQYGGLPTAHTYPPFCVAIGWRLAASRVAADPGYLRGVGIAAETGAAQGRQLGRLDRPGPGRRAGTVVISPSLGSDGDLRGYAAQLGLDVAAFDRDRASIAVADRIRRDVDSGLASGQVAGTPTLFIDGVVHRGGYDPPALLAALPHEPPCPHAASIRLTQLADTAAGSEACLAAS